MAYNDAFNDRNNGNQRKRDIVARLRWLRVGYRAIADEMGCSLSTVSHMMQNPDEAQFERIMSALDSVERKKFD